MAGDEHHPSPPKLLDDAEAIVEQRRAEHDGEAGDDGGSRDRAVLDFVKRSGAHHVYVAFDAAEYFYNAVDTPGYVQRRGYAPGVDNLRFPFDPPPADGV